VDRVLKAVENVLIERDMQDLKNSQQIALTIKSLGQLGYK
jgi:hypothetical protein